MNDIVKITDQNTQVPGEGDKTTLLLTAHVESNGDTQQVVQETRGAATPINIDTNGKSTEKVVLDENLELAQYFCGEAKKLAEDSAHLVKVDAPHDDWQPFFKKYNALNNSIFPKEQYPELYTQFQNDLRVFDDNKEKFRRAQEQVKNVNKAQQFFTKFMNLKLSGDTKKDFETLREYDKQWWSMKNLPNEQYGAYKKEFENIFNKHLESMPTTQSEKDIFTLENFINSVSNKKNAKDLLMGKRKYTSAKSFEAQQEYNGYTAFSGNLPGALQRKKNAAKEMVASYQKQFDMINKALDKVSPGWRNEKKPNPSQQNPKK